MQVYTREQIATLITHGHVLVLNRRSIYRLNSWLATHPGGALSILHFVGRDAADELEAYHCPATQKRMKSFVIGQVDPKDWDENGWKPIVPPVQIGWPCHALDYADVPSIKQSLAADSPPKSSRPSLSLADLQPPAPPEDIVPSEQYRISKAYHDLHQKVIDQGLYDPKPVWLYRWELCRYSLLFIAFTFSFYYSKQTWQYLVSALFLGLFWHQVTFVVHDAGHVGISGNYWQDRLIGTLIADFLGGLSVGWWCDNHNIHHLVTNHPEHDPDIQHIPFFAITPKFFSNLFSTYYRRIMAFDPFSKRMVALQHKLYYIVMSLARFNLFANSYAYLFGKMRPGFFRNLEMTGVVVFWCWFGALLKSIPGWKLRIAFVLVSFMAASPLHVQIVLSHFAQSTEDLGLYESFAHRQLRTTMDVSCPNYLDFIHGGLHMQVSHHLFPRLPRHRLREASLLVQDFVKEQKVKSMEYHIYGFVEGNGRVLQVLKDVADQVALLGKVAKQEVADMVEGKCH